MHSATLVSSQQVVSEYESTILFSLLRSGLWETTVDDLSLFPLSPQIWQRIYHLATVHTVRGILFRAFYYLPETLQPAPELMAKWLVESDAIEGHNRQMDAALDSISRFFFKNGLRPLLLKGQGVAAFYEIPAQRECGDIDFCFPNPAHFDRAVQLLKFHGIAVQAKPDGSQACRWQDVEVELHPHLLDLANPRLLGWVRSLTESQTPLHETLTLPSGLQIDVPSSTVNLLLLNTHILKHLFGRGIGLRQFCDMARAYHTLHNVCDSDMLRNYCQKVGIMRWTRQLHAVLTRCLGLPTEELPFPDCDAAVSPHLLNQVLRDGNFGQERRATVSPSSWRRKLDTAAAYCAHIRMSATYAPMEAFWNVASLIRGNFSR